VSFEFKISSFELVSNFVFRISNFTWLKGANASAGKLAVVCIPCFVTIIRMVMKAFNDILLGCIEDAVIMQNEEGRILQWNHSAERVFGYSQEEACGFSIEQLVPDSLRPQFWETVRSVLAGKSVQNTHVVRLTRDGHELDVHESMLPVKGEGGRIVGVVHLVRDPEELRRRKAAEILSNQPQIALTLAHELRSPLLAINNIVYLLEHKMDQRHLPMMKRQLALCDSIISNLLEFTITRKPQRQHVLLQQLLDETLSVMSIPSNVQLICRNAGTLMLWIDPTHIRQTLLNLMNNALEAIGDRSGRLEVSFDQEASIVRIHLMDTGGGMADSVYRKLFQPLMTTKKKGMGLGLLTCKQLVEANDGTLTVENRKGHGCVFTVTLPRSSSASA